MLVALTQDAPPFDAPWTPPEISADSAMSRPAMDLRSIAQPAAGKEDLKYAVRYDFIQAGEARLRTVQGPEYGGRPTWRIVGTGRSTGLGKVPENACIPVHCTRSTLSPI